MNQWQSSITALINLDKLVKRNRYDMPEYIEKQLLEYGVMEDYLQRPAYQRNDYIGWIERAKREETKKKRIDQMLEELKKGGVYMKMKHSPSSKEL